MLNLSAKKLEKSSETAEPISKKLKILVLATDVFSTGGIQRYIRYQIKALRSIDWLDKIVVFSLWPKRQDDLFEEDFRVDYEGKGADFFSKIIFSLRAIAVAVRKKPDLVLCNHISFTPLAAIIQKLTGIPYSVNVYGLEIWSSMRKRELEGLKEAKAIIGDCKFTLEYIKDNFNINEGKMFLLYDCVDMEKFSPQAVAQEIYDKYSIDKNKKIVSVFGRLVYDKGQETMIRFLKFLPEEIILLIVGSGPRLKDWKELAKAEGVENRVIFTGRVPEEDLIYMYNLSDFVIYLSEFKKYEGGALPLVLIEASACEKPIIGSNQDGAAEAVKDGFNGFVVPPRDQETIVKKIKYLFSQPSVLREMGKNGRQYVKENFSYEIFRQNQETILKKILA